MPKKKKESTSSSADPKESPKDSKEVKDPKESTPTTVPSKESKESSQPAKEGKEPVVTEFNSKQKQRHPDVNSALHIIKGAIVKVLHTPLTTSTEAQKRGEGRISVEYTLPEPPSEDQVKRIEKLSNDKIKENVPLKYFTMGRKEAEEKYRKNLVNETFIYDKKPVPEQLTELSIVEIPEWNVNCSAGPLLKTTGEVPPIVNVRINHRPQKKEIEFVFSLQLETPSAKKPESTPVSTTKRFETEESDNVQAVAEKIMQDMFSLLEQKGIPVKEKQKEIENVLRARVQEKLTTLKNTAYTRGMYCIPPTQSQMGFH